MSTWALVPVKARHTGKQRLAAALGDERRAQLVRCMLDDVLAALAACAAIDGTLVMSPERDALPATTLLLHDPAAGMNAALDLALASLAQRGATCVALIAADLPLLTPAEVTELVAAAQTPGVALAPDARGTGTNALCLRLPTGFRCQFGPGSFALHQAEAVAQGIAPVTVSLAGLAFDVDEPADLASLKAQRLARYGFLG
jgi:2-phospho-L-lactate/phosphoenolpyruvate guanylyltransferase